MADKTPIRTVYTSGVATGLAEFQTGETVALAHGGLGAALSLGTAGQVIKVNSGASALEFGAVEAIINIDTATDLTSNTLATGDQLMASDGGTEGRVTLAQLDTLFSGTSKTLTNKTLTTPVISSISNTGTITLPTSTDTLVGKATTDTLTNKTLTTPVISSVSNSGTITIPTGTDTLVGKATTDTLTNKTLTSPVFNTGVSGTAVLDSDTMSGASATTLSTSESIKAYVDAQITAEDLDVTSDSGTIDIDLDSETMTIAGGTGIDTSATGTTVTVAIDGTVVTGSSTDTFTNKTFDLGDTGNSLTGSLTEFNTALQSESFVGLAATQTLTNKTLTSPKINEDVVVTSTATELNLLDGVSGLVQADFTKLAALTASAAELNYTDGVSSNIQTQIDTKTTPAFAIAQAIALG